MMENIGIVTTWFERGASYISRQYEKLLQDDYNVYIYARGGIYEKNNPVYNRENVWWGRRDGRPISAAINLEDFRKWIESRNITVVLFNEQSWWVPVIECRKLGVVAIAYIDYYTKDTVPLFELYDAVICNTRRHYSVFSWHQGAHYIPYGVDLDVFTQSEVQAQGTPIRLFHSCGFSPWRKGTDLLLRAITKVQTDYHLTIHTQKDLSVLGKYYIRIIDKMIDQGTLTVVNKTVPAPGLYNNHDIYVYPSRLDGIGLSLPEAIASGNVIVATNAPPMNEFTDECFAWLVDVGSTYSRDDGYYWDVTEVQLDDLQAKIYAAIADVNIEKKKQCAREYACRELNWDERKTLLVDIVRSIKTRSIDENVLSRAIEYEDSRLSWKMRLYDALPGSIVRYIFKNM